MVSVFPGRFVTKPQKAPALTVSQTVKAVADKYRGRRAEENAREGSEGVGGCWGGDLGEWKIATA